MSSQINHLKLKFNDLISRTSFSPTSDCTQTGYWRKMFATWLCVWLFFVSLSSSYTLLNLLGQTLLSIHVTKLIRRGLKLFTNKQVIENTAGKAVFITGCDSGFGHQLVIELDKLGFKVFAGCLFPEGSGAQALRDAASDRVEVLKIDVTDQETIGKAYEVVEKHCEETKYNLWALINNAGVGELSEIEWCPIEVYQKVLNVNTLGVIRVTKKFLPLLRKSFGNRIVIIASLAGRFTFPGFTAYSMSKHAAISFADGLRIEMMKWGISVHTVEPTFYRTPIIENIQMEKSLEEYWLKCPETVKASYGREYLEEFKVTMRKHISNAKPNDKIHEVIDAMVHAVAGEHPECRYVPSLYTELRSNILMSLPREIRDEMFSSTTPKSPLANREGLKSETKFTF